ncbi:hypothetical protein E3P99_00623 [Wallemia hederae]|uniref:Prenyltransferase alpha-alpha toroid domain-containing protein n=1 Tax=Wallemia hederae TaxID=1540922 RepID=A0A4T0FTY6_9BASI|nr:hypothetical protein E3P99_00623 [Wallemia hederae]
MTFSEISSFSPTNVMIKEMAKPATATQNSKFLSRHLQLLPSAYESNDTARLTLAFFIVEAMAIVGESVTEESRRGYIDYIYSCQLTHSNGGGFRGSLSMGKQRYDQNEIPTYDPSNLTMTYTAILLLGLLRDDFTRLDMAGVLQSIRDRRHPDGSFSPTPTNSESDIRLVYCACAISTLIGDFSAIDVASTLAYIHGCRTYDGSYSQIPNAEGQGGTTYCALASLEMISKHLSQQNRQQELLSQEDVHCTLRWLAQRQVDGFQGRTNKDSDTCYSFWIRGAFNSLKSLANLPTDLHLFDDEQDGHFIISCAHALGGIAKYPDEFPDVLHNCLGLSALSMAQNRVEQAQSFSHINSTLNVDVSSLEHIHTCINTLKEPL